MKKKNYILLSLLCIAFISVIIFYSLKLDITKLNILNLKTQIISSLFVMIGTIVAVWQFLLASKQVLINKQNELQLREKELYEKEKYKVTRAIDLSGYYKDNILTNGSVLIYLFKSVGIYSILDNIKLEKMHEFDINELEENLSQIEIKRIEKLINSKELLQELGNISLSCDIEGDFKREVIEYVDGEEVTNVEFNLNELDKCFRNMVSDTLNNMEYFAMNFVHKIADESVIYQSLHQSYIELCKVLYYIISSRNKNGEEKYFTKVTDLYIIWKDRLLSQRKQEIEHKRKNILKGTTLG